MRVVKTRDGEVTGLVLSRRNLLTLLAKLDGAPSWSQRTILAPAAYGRFVLTAEEDEEHYNNPERLLVTGEVGRAGRMHPETEAELARDRERREARLQGRPLPGGDGTP
jgi:hypothetical protein